MGQRHVCGIAAVRYEDATDSGGVVAWIKGVPTVAQINFNPCGKIHRRVRRRKDDVSDVTSAIASRDVQTTAEGDCKMRQTPRRSWYASNAVLVARECS